MSGHTPGPWTHADKPVSEGYTCGGPCGPPHHIFKAGDVLVLPPAGNAGPIAIAAGLANAALIASAPTLAADNATLRAQLAEARAEALEEAAKLCDAQADTHRANADKLPFPDCLGDVGKEAGALRCAAAIRALATPGTGGGHG